VPIALEVTTGTKIILSKDVLLEKYFADADVT
jgi:hypothetical protein